MDLWTSLQRRSMIFIQQVNSTAEFIVVLPLDIFFLSPHLVLTSVQSRSFYSNFRSLPNKNAVKTITIISSCQPTYERF